MLTQMMKITMSSNSSHKLHFHMKDFLHNNSVCGLFSDLSATYNYSLQVHELVQLMTTQLIVCILVKPYCAQRLIGLPHQTFQKSPLADSTARIERC